MSLRSKVLVPMVFSTAFVCGCFPYKNLDGDYYSGPVDPVNFPPAYQGAGFESGGNFGTFMAALATVNNGDTVAYYLFPGATTKLRTESSLNGVVTIKDRAPVYVFDGDPSADSAKCVAPKDYVFDQRRD